MHQSRNIRELYSVLSVIRLYFIYFIPIILHAGFFKRLIFVALTFMSFRFLSRDKHNVTVPQGKKEETVQEFM